MACFQGSGFKAQSEPVAFKPIFYKSMRLATWVLPWITSNSITSGF